MSKAEESMRQHTELTRRTFIRAGGTGIAAVAIPALYNTTTGGTVANAEGSHRTTLTTPELIIHFDRRSGLPASYRLIGTGSTFLGAQRDVITSAQWQYQGGRNSGEYEHDIHVTKTNGASFEFTFTGTGVEYVTDLNTDKGTMDMYVDGEFVETVDAYNDSRVWQSPVFTTTGLTEGPHTLKGIKRSGEYAIVDAFIVQAGGSTSTVNNDDAAVSYSSQGGFTNNIGAVVIHRTRRDEVAADLALEEIAVQGDRADVTYRVTAGDVKAGSFTMRYAVDGTSVQMTLQDVTESNDRELIEVHTPSLVSITQQEKDAWLAHAEGGGQWASLAAASNAGLPYGERGLFPNFSVLPVVLLGKANAAVAMEVQGYLSNTALNIYDQDDTRVATVGTVTLHRVPGGTTTPSLLVEQPEAVRLDFVANRKNSVDWIDAANLVKARFSTNPTDYYDDKFLYAIQGQVGPTDRTDPVCTFAEMEKLIERVSLLIDGAPQVTFVAGWPEGGHDTSYPAIRTVNPELGGKPGWDRLQRRARERFNTNVTLDDNWDDQYKNSYTEGIFDEEYITATREGELERHMAWNGVDLSYITGFAKYMTPSGPGRKRARVTIDYYGLKDGVLIDGMSWWSIRNDWDPEHPASAIRNLVEGKFVCLDEYAKRDVHVGSELLRYPFAGRLAFTMDGPTGGGWNGFEGTPIPLMSLILRHSTIYGINSGSSPDVASTLFHNNRTHTWLGPETTDEKITALYYLNYLPWMILHHLPVRTFERTGNDVVIGMGTDTMITIAGSPAKARVVHEGVEIVKGDSVTIPIDQDRLAFYSQQATTLTYPLPKGIPPTSLTARRLTGTGHVLHPVTVEEQNITVHVPAQSPVVVTLHR